MASYNTISTISGSSYSGGFQVFAGTAAGRWVPTYQDTNEAYANLNNLRSVWDNSTMRSVIPSDQIFHDLSLSLWPQGQLGDRIGMFEGRAYYDSTCQNQDYLGQYNPYSGGYRTVTPLTQKCHRNEAIINPSNRPYDPDYKYKHQSCSYGQKVIDAPRDQTFNVYGYGRGSYNLTLQV